MTDYSSNPFGAAIDTAEITDGSITTAKIADGAITTAKISAGASNAFADPIGSVVAWLKSLTGTPALSSGWVECNGQTISDAESVYNGVTIPNLNGGSNRMLRGSSTSGTTGGSDTHTHDNSEGGGASGNTAETITEGLVVRFTDSNSNSDNSKKITASSSSLPAYYEIVWILRIK